jgi:hypothetical protein
VFVFVFVCVYVCSYVWYTDFFEVWQISCLFSCGCPLALVKLYNMVLTKPRIKPEYPCVSVHTPGLPNVYVIYVRL